MNGTTTALADLQVLIRQPKSKLFQARYSNGTSLMLRAEFIVMSNGSAADQVLRSVSAV